MFWAARALQWHVKRVLQVEQNRGRKAAAIHKACLDWARPLELLVLNEEFLVIARSLTCAECVPAFCTHRPSLLPIGP